MQVLRNKQGGNLMIHTKDEQEGQRQAIQAEREELQQATRRFIVSLVRTGGSVALLPVSRLPREPRQHFLAAGREFTRGWAALVREFADGIEGLAKETSTLTHDGADDDATREMGKSHGT
jgi:hypothetical protein